MTVVYLHHSGFVVELEDITLVFDPISEIPEKLLNKNRNVLIFVSHVHGDHYHDSIWNYNRPGVKYILSDDVWSRKNASNIVYIKPYESFRIDNVNVQTFGSTDQGVSFLVDAENKLIFFSGDLNWWAWDTKKRPHINPEVEERDYKNEISKLKEFLDGRTIDLAFVPVDPRLDMNKGELYAAQYFIDELHPKELVPMHFWGDFGVIDRLKAALGPNNTTKIGTFSSQNEVVTT